MAKFKWKACFRRQGETTPLLQHTTKEQPPKYSEGQHQEQDYEAIGQFLSTAEKSKIDQQTTIEKWNSETEAEKEKNRSLYKNLIRHLIMQPDESLEKLMKSDLIELVDTARHEALKPFGPNLIEQLNIARGEPSQFPILPTKVSTIPAEKVSQLDLIGLLYIARITPYYEIPKTELLRVHNAQLVGLFREALEEHLQRFRLPSTEKSVYNLE
jgi:hypothetical protein